MGTETQATDAASTRLNQCAPEMAPEQAFNSAFVCHLRDPFGNSLQNYVGLLGCTAPGCGASPS
jgi:hypothetical protein